VHHGLTLLLAQLVLGGQPGHQQHNVIDLVLALSGELGRGILHPPFRRDHLPRAERLCCKPLAKTHESG
jgi:hypothetical protein